MILVRQLISKGAASHGERLAVVSDRARSSYADLDVKSDRLAGALVARGVISGDRVVVFMRDSVEAVVGIAAVLKAGAVLVPIDCATDASDLAYVFDDCRAVAVITEARLAGVAAEAMRHAVSVRLVVLAGGDLRPAAGAGYLAYEEVVGRAARAAAPEAAEDGHPLMLVYPRTPGGLAAPVTLTDRDVLMEDGDISRSAVGAVVDDVRPMAGSRGIAALLAAIAAGKTIVLPRGGQALPRQGRRASAA
jgi:long-chain acyl-CoA synthetase